MFIFIWTENVTFNYYYTVDWKDRLTKILTSKIPPLTSIKLYGNILKCVPINSYIGSYEVENV